VTKPLKLIAANDTFGALLAFTDVLDGKLAVFITPPEVNGKMPETFGLPDEVADDVALIVESSGSTGTPKRIEISREALLNSANASALALGSIEASSQWLLALPINFIAGANVLIRSVLAGNQPVMMNTSVPFTAEAFARSASHLKADRRYTSLVPAQLKRVVDAAEADDFIRVQLAKFDAILVGGQSVPAELVARAHALGANIVVTYGMTETSGGCVYNGNPLAQVEVRIASDGRVAIRGATLANVATDDRGYFVTNDAGEIDDAGKLIIHGRIDRVITSGGIKVSLDRVEALGASVVGVADIAAVAIDDSEWGQRVGIAYVGSPEVADTVALALANDLGPAGKPVRILRVDGVPKLSAGKNDLQAIKKLFEEKR
jgi:O-succinylbenzoic acid--CoA ligase